MQTSVLTLQFKIMRAHVLLDFIYFIQTDNLPYSIHLISTSSICSYPPEQTPFLLIGNSPKNIKIQNA